MSGCVQYVSPLQHSPTRQERLDREMLERIIAFLRSHSPEEVLELLREAARQLRGY
jgi:hypothetical protein